MLGSWGSGPRASLLPPGDHLLHPPPPWGLRSALLLGACVAHVRFSHLEVKGPGHDPLHRGTQGDCGEWLCCRGAEGQREMGRLQGGHNPLLCTAMLASWCLGR